MSKELVTTSELHFLNHLFQAHKNEKNLDAEVHVDGSVFKASKFLLCIGSPVIKAAFAHNVERPNTLIIDNFDTKIVEQFLSFLHTGKLTLDPPSFDLLIPIADFFDVVPLLVVCIESMHANLNAHNVMKYYAAADKFKLRGLKVNASQVFQKSITTENVYDRYKFVISSGYAELQETLVDFMKINVDQLCLSSVWSLMDEDLKQKLLNFQQMQTDGIKLKLYNGVPENFAFSSLLAFIVVGMRGVECEKFLKRFLFKKPGEQFSKDGINGHCRENYMFNDEPLLIHFWDVDTQSLHLYKRIIEILATGVFLIYDISNADSYKEAIVCLNQIRKIRKQGVVMLIGSKCDPSRPRQIQTKDAYEFAQRHKLLFAEILSLDSKDVTLALETAVSEMLKGLKDLKVEDTKNCTIM